jgi:hypothetical protein
MKNSCPREDDSIRTFKRMLGLSHKRKNWWVNADDTSKDWTSSLPVALCISEGCSLKPRTAPCPAKERGVMYAVAVHVLPSCRRARVRLDLRCDTRRTFSYDIVGNRRDLSQSPAQLDLHLKQPLDPRTLHATGISEELKVHALRNFLHAGWAVTVTVTREEFHAASNQWVEVEPVTEFSLVGRATRA